MTGWLPAPRSAPLTAPSDAAGLDTQRGADRGVATPCRCPVCFVDRVILRALLIIGSATVLAAASFVWGVLGETVGR